MKEAKNLTGAMALIGRAVAKLQRAVELGLDDWTAVHTEKFSITNFSRKKLEKNPQALEELKATCGGAGGLVLNEGSLEFIGDKALVPKLKAAVQALDADYETWIEIEDEDTFSLLDAREEIGSIAKRNQVKISRDASWLGITGAPKGADNAAQLLKSLLAGKEDLDCPKNLVRKAIARAKEVESETGAIIAVETLGGFGGGGVIYIRGLEECVSQATTAFRFWLDELEGFVSEFVSSAGASGQLAGHLFDQFRNDTQMMGQKFQVAVKQTSTLGQLEIRGLPEKVAEANKELEMILAFYRKEQAKFEAQAKAIAKAEEPPPQAEEDDEWGAAPTAEPVPGAW